MPIRITCHFCNKAFSAWDDLAGQSVKCPKCGQQTVVPGPGNNPALDPPKRPAASSLSTRPANPPNSATSPAPPAAPPRAVKVTPGPARVNPSSAPSAPPPAPPPAPPSAPPSVRSGTNPASGSARRPATAARLSAPSAPAQPVQPIAPDTAPCPNCGAAMPLSEDLCDECGYHMILRKVLDTSGVHRHDDSTGFERFFKSQISEYETAEGAIFWAQVFFGFMFVFMCHRLLGMTGFVISVAAVIAYALYRKATRQQREEAREQGKRDLFSSTIWKMFLHVQRGLGWRQSKWPFPKAQVYTMHAHDFEDDELSEIDDPDSLDVMDLEGTRITDVGLAKLEKFKRLKFVVLRRTQVTQAGVTRLQRSLRNAWIWWE